LRCGSTIASVGDDELIRSRIIVARNFVDLKIGMLFECGVNGARPRNRGAARLPRLSRFSTSRELFTATSLPWHVNYGNIQDRHRSRKRAPC
jgi:hypothetical protein